MKHKHTISQKRIGRKRGFSLLEVLISTVLAILVTGALIGSIIMNLSGQRITRSHNRNLSEANKIMSRMVYGWDVNPGLRAVKGEDFSVVTEGANTRLLLGNDQYLLYQRQAQRIVDQDGDVYGRYISNFTAVKGNGDVELSMTVEDRRLTRPITQVITSTVAFRNDS